MKNILIIKLGALGDFIYSIGPMRAIKNHHVNDRIILLTRKPYVELAKQTGIFDDIIIDDNPKLNPLSWLHFRKKLNAFNFSRVYDLQNNDRTEIYSKLFNPKPEWSGIARGATHRNIDPNRGSEHAFIGHQKTLNIAGIKNVELDNLSFLMGDKYKFDLKKPYALLIPGSSEQHAEKRWPANHYRDLAVKLIARNIHPVFIGSKSETLLCCTIASELDVTNLTGQTDYSDLVTLAHGAEFCVGNDTGPTHVVSMTGCKCVVIYNTHKSNIQKHGPQHPNSLAIENGDLNQIAVSKILEILNL